MYPMILVCLICIFMGFLFLEKSCNGSPFLTHNCYFEDFNVKSKKDDLHVAPLSIHFILIFHLETNLALLTSLGRSNFNTI